jgi:hypothetical protein
MARKWYPKKVWVAPPTPEWLQQTHNGNCDCGEPLKIEWVSYAVQRLNCSTHGFQRFN